MQARNGNETDDRKRDEYGCKFLHELPIALVITLHILLFYGHGVLFRMG